MADFYQTGVLATFRRLGALDTMSTCLRPAILAWLLPTGFAVLPNMTSGAYTASPL